MKIIPSLKPSAEAEGCRAKCNVEQSLKWFRFNGSHSNRIGSVFPRIVKVFVI